MKRQNEGEINVCLTDKSSNWAVMERDIYLELGKAHTDKDEMVDREYMMKCADILDGHSSCWVKMTGQSDHWGQQRRVRESYMGGECAPIYVASDKGSQTTKF